MSTIIVSCACGERYHADADAHVGRRIKCRCGRTLEIRPRAGVRMSMLPRASGTLWRRLRGLLRRAPPDEGVVRKVKVPRARRAARTGRLARVTTLADRVLPPLSWGYVGVVLVASAVLWAWADRWWPATVLLFMGRWVLLLPLAVLLPAAALFDRRMLPPLLLAGVACMVVVMGYRLPWRRLFGGARPSGYGLRVVSFNAAGGRPLALDLEPVLAEWAADVVAVQECGDELTAAMSTLPGWHFHRSRMLCLLSRYPIERAEVMDRSALDVTERSGEGGAGDVLRYVIESPGGAVRVVNLHLETARKGFDALAELDLQGMRDNLLLRDGESRLARRWADGSVRALAGAYEPPLVVAGDFNMPPESRIFRAHWGDLRDAFAQAGSGFGFTRHNGWIRARIDHVLTDDRWHTAEAEVWRDLGSDHRPLVVELVLAGGHAREGRHESREELPVVPEPGQTEKD